MNELLMTEGVTLLLDKNEENSLFSDNNALYIDIFGKKSERLLHPSGLMPIERIETMSSPLSTNDSNKKIKARLSSHEKNAINGIVKNKIALSDREAEKLNECLSQDIINQKLIFEERKRKKKLEINKQKLSIIKQSICEINVKKKEEKEKKKQSNVIKKTLSILSCNDQSIERLSNPFKRQLSVNTKMFNEIEKSLNRSIIEMFKALDELRESYNEEIKSYECKYIRTNYIVVNGLKEFAICLKEERDDALENLKCQYEDQRERETEQIKQKFKYNSSVNS